MGRAQIALPEHDGLPPETILGAGGDLGVLRDPSQRGGGFSESRRSRAGYDFLVASV